MPEGVGRMRVFVMVVVEGAAREREVVVVIVVEIEVVVLCAVRGKAGTSRILLTWWSLEWSH